MFREAAKTLYSLAVIVSVLSGVILLPLKIKLYFNSSVLGIFVGAVLVAILFGGIIYHITAPGFILRFGINRHKTSPILATDEEIVTIDECYNAEINTSKILVYPEVPDKEDLVDMIELAHENLDETIYRSNDSTIEKIVRRTGKTLAIYWKPKKNIIPFVPYHHETVYRSPSPYGDDAFWHAHHIDLDTGTLNNHRLKPVGLNCGLKVRIPAKAG